MADLMTGQSRYASGEIDTATTQENNSPVPIKGEASAAKINGVATAIVQIEGILGTGPDLKGSRQDLVDRLSVRHNPDGTHKTLHVFEGGTGSALANMGKRLAGLDTDTVQFLDFLRLQVFIASGTFTVPAGVTSFFVETFGGGGGGGGGGGAWNNGVGGTGSGGNGSRGRPGGYAATLATAQTPGTTYAVTISAGGSGGAGGTGGATGAAGSVGTAGTSASFGGICAATGGAGGNSGGGGASTGASAFSETLADGQGTIGTYTISGHGASPGAGGAGGVLGGLGEAPDGASGASGSGSLVLVWY